MQIDIVEESADILKLGLLFGEDQDVTGEDLPEVLSFKHLLIQEYVAAIYITHKILEDQRFLETAFPTWAAIEKRREVVRFVCGLLKETDASPMVNHVCQKMVENTYSSLEHGKGLSLIGSHLGEDEEEDRYGDLPLLWVFQEEGGVDKFNEFLCVYPDSGYPLSYLLNNTQLVVIRSLTTDLSDLDSISEQYSAKIIFDVYAKGATADTTDERLHYVLVKLGSKDNILGLHINRTKLLASLGVLPKSLMYLTLTRCDINTEDQCELLVGLGKMHRLKYLHLPSNRMKEHGFHVVQGLKELAPQSQLKNLNLDGSFLPCIVSELLLETLCHHAHLERLQLSGNMVGGKMKLFTTSSPKQLKELVMRMCSPSKEDILSISSAFHTGKFQNLEHLSLSANRLTDSVLEPLMEAVLATQSQRKQSILLDVRRNKLSESFLKEWVQAFATMDVEIKK